MTLSTLIIRIGITAIILTLLIAFIKFKGFAKVYENLNDDERADQVEPTFMHGHENWLMAFLQYFCGVWFLFSGYVKAVDPLGTSYKLVDYFNEFKLAFEGTWFSFLAPIFPFISEHCSVSFSVVTIVFELVLGWMLVTGTRPKFTSWSFFFMLLFFTFLTGFTYLTGYVTGGANFFDFSAWGEYDSNNMRVTDCGCFGDFLKLEPKVSFIKDLFLMIPAFFFIWKFKAMTQLFTKNIRDWSTILIAAGALLFCFSNYVWDIPSVDFRPFKEGANVKAIKEKEQAALANVPISYVLENKDSKEVVTLPMNEYLKRYSSDFPKEAWSVLETIKGEPTVKQTKISDFSIKELEYGDDISESLLEEKGYSFMMVCYMLKGEGEKKSRTVIDTTFRMDTLNTFENGIEQTVFEKKVVDVKERTEEYYDMIWEEEYLDKFTNSVIPFYQKANSAKIPMYGVIGKADNKALMDFVTDSGVNFPLYTADDILLKTIVRSNPGIVLWKDGSIVKKWHISKLPEFETIQKEYLK